MYILSIYTDTPVNGITADVVIFNTFEKAKEKLLTCFKSRITEDLLTKSAKYIIKKVENDENYDGSLDDEEYDIIMEEHEDHILFKENEFIHISLAYNHHEDTFRFTVEKLEIEQRYDIA